jgi:hypothetical protein
MANLTDKQINNTYKSLLKTVNNSEITGAVEISDGAGNGTGITIGNDGQIVTNGVISFGSIKDAGENITISKFVDEADGIPSNDNDTTIPTSAAVIDYVESQITLDDLDFAADTGSGSVDLDSQILNINGGNNVTTNATGQTVTINADGTNLGITHNTGSVGVSSSTGTGTTINPATTSTAGVMTSSDKTKLDSIQSGAGVNPTSTDELTEGSSNLYYTETRVSSNSDVVANTAKVGITSQQVSAIEVNTNKVGITVDQANAIVSNTAKNSYPTADATKVGHISVTQAVNLDTLESDVTTNNAKVGITTQQAADITANNAKISFDNTSSTKLAGIEDGAQVNPTSTDGLTEGGTNLYYTDARVSANTDVAANTAKVGITAQQAADIVTNNAKVGITTQQAADIVTNNAKVSFDSASSTKLAGIEAGAEVNVNADWNATTGDAQILNKPTLATVATTGAYSDLSGTPSLATVATTGSYNDLSDQPTIPTNNNQLTNGAGYITDGNTNWDNTYGFITASSTDTLTNKSGNNSQWTNDAGYINLAAQTAHTNAIGNAIDFSARVTLAGGVAEGTSGIIKNLQSIL